MMIMIGIALASVCAMNHEPEEPTQGCLLRSLGVMIFNKEHKKEEQNETERTVY